MVKQLWQLFITFLHRFWFSSPLANKSQDNRNYALAHLLLLYGIIIRGATHSTYLQKLKSLQNRAFRAVVGAHFRDSMNRYYSELKILQIDDLFKFELAEFAHGSLNHKTLKSFCKHCCKTNDSSSRATKQSTDCNNLNIPCKRRFCFYARLI